MASSTNKPSKKSLRGSGEAGQQGSHNGEKSTKFARRTSSGRYVNLSKEDIDMSSDVSADYMNYTVHIPSTPDNQPMDSTSVAMKAEEQYVSNSLFTGGFNSVTRAHLMDKVIDSEVKHPQMAGAKGSSCSICDGKVMKDERGNDVTPCECRYKICRDCFIDAQNDSGMCPGCKEPYKVGDYEDDNPDYENGALPLLAATGSKQSTNNMSVMKRNQNGEFDHNKWLFETKGTYGVGNAYWPPDAEDDRNDGLHGGGGVFDASEKPWKPLCRKRPIPSGILSPYRLLFGVRFVVMCLFLHWRVAHPNKEAMWLWAMSITCEIWFGFSWMLEQIPKLYPINRSTDLVVLHEKFDSPSPSNPTGKSDLPGVDLFVSTAEPDNEPPLVTANTILSILAVDYPVEKLACYVSDDGGALLTFEALAEAASFADLWVPFCRKHNIEPRNPESYFALKVDPTKNKSKLDFVKDRRRVKREYDEFKVRINSLSDSIRRRSDAFNARDEMKMMKHFKESGADPSEPIKKVLKATWMADGTHWPGTWASSSREHSKDDHAGILQVMLKPPSPDSLMGSANDKIIDFSEVDTRLPMLVYVAREKRPAYDHNKKAGAMNALVRASAILSNGPFILNLDCDHYIYNCKAIREGMCFMMDRGGEDICYIQFPQRFESIDPSDRYANHSTVFFDANMRAFDGLQGPFYVGTGCMFKRFALYGFDPPLSNWEKKNAKKSSELDPPMGKREKNNAKKSSRFGSSRFGRFLGNREKKNAKKSSGFDPPSDNWEKENAKSTEESIDEEDSERTPILKASQFDQGLDIDLLPKRFGNSLVLTKSIPVAELQGRPLADNTSIKYGREPGTLRTPREPLEAGSVAEAVSVISCWYEDKTEWGDRVGWIYGSVTEDVVTGYRMHNRGWRSVYCVTKRDAFRGSAPVNLTDLLHQVLRSATGSVEIFFSKNNAIFGSKRLKLLQRLAYLNFGIYPFTSIFLIVYCFLPALSLFSGFFIVQTFTFAFLIYLLTMTVCVVALAILEMKWSGVELEQWWRNEQFWLVSGISAHLAAVIQGLLKVVADLYIVKWTSLIIPPIVIAMVNVIAIAVAISRTIYSANPQWSKFIAGAFFSFWVLSHLYPFAKGLMGRRGKTPTIVYVWSGLIAITISLLWIAISSPLGAGGGGAGRDFQFP